MGRGAGEGDGAVKGRKRVLPRKEGTKEGTIYPMSSFRGGRLAGLALPVSSVGESW